MLLRRDPWERRARYRRSTPEIDLPREFDDYVIGRELGRGATGRVYLAEDAILARAVAIKFIEKTDAAARQRFLLEARAVAQIHHPNVVGIYRSGMLDSRPYFVTELVRGTSLAKLTKPVPWESALDIAIGLARGLAAVHRRNVVHCDLKPSNVMIDLDGVAKIIDFGLARLATDGTNPGHMPVGTPEYMAPEVWCGETPTRRADVFSLGAVLFELLAGTPPFSDVEPTALRQRVMTGDAPALRERAPEVDPALADVIARCLHRDRALRFADGDELREALERLHPSRRYTARAGENPYRGLLPFEASHRGVFFGRGSEIDTVISRLRAESIVLVTGDSGVGKSSLCRAGVVPAVVDGELGGVWRALSIVPGPRPLTALASAVGDPALVALLRDNPALLPRELRRHADGHGLILFVDQLEELITLGDPAEVAALDSGLAALADGVPGLRLLATARADFLARISTLPGLGRDLSHLLYFLRPLPPERLRDVIVGPAEAVGARFESSDIVEDLVAATAQAGSGGLPLLSFALADLWEARDRDGDVISRAAVVAMGGVDGALSRHADVVIGGMIATDRACARSVLLRLVTAMGTRIRRTATELALGESARTALDALVKGRLVVVRDGEPEPVYELAHECLLTGWGTLRLWLDADRTDRATRERLSAAAAGWVRLGRRDDGTWQGRQLDEAAALDPATMSEDDRAFVVASRRAAQRRLWQRGLAAFGAVVLVVLAFAFQRYLARREIAAAIADELLLAHDLFGNARDAERAGNDLAAQAFAAFDTGQRDEAEPLWRQVAGRRDGADREYRNASRHLEIALARDPTRADVRNLLGDILISRALLAEQVHDNGQRDEALERLALYDADGSRRARWIASGRVVVRAPADAAIKLESGRILGSGTVDVLLPPASYVVVIETPGRVVVRAPILVERGSEHRIDVTPPRTDDVPRGFIYVPSGEFLYGSASDSERVLFDTTPLRPRFTLPFLISRTEVTFGEWLAYVDALPPRKRAARLPAASTKMTGGVAITPDGAGHWNLELEVYGKHYAAGWDKQITYPGRTYHATQDWRLFPVLGVSAEDANAYAAWLDATGRVPGARLCSEIEWERAARGADGRAYPGGETVEPADVNLAFTHGDERMGPDEVGAHPGSTSPFGLVDMVGNAFELAESEKGGYTIRGGSYGHDLVTAQLPNRGLAPDTMRDSVVGFRLCARPTVTSVQLHRTPSSTPNSPHSARAQPIRRACREQTSW
jgi:formylglycine-generating enzyme required for sulfatase activity